MRDTPFRQGAQMRRDPLMLPERAAHRRHANYAASAVPFAQQMPAVPQAFLLGRGLRGSNICGAQRVETWPGRAGCLDMANLRDDGFALDGAWLHPRKLILSRPDQHVARRGECRCVPKPGSVGGLDRPLGRQAASPATLSPARHPPREKRKKQTKFGPFP